MSIRFYRQNKVWVPVIFETGKELVYLESAHISTGGHCGINKMSKFLIARCFWEAMSIDIMEYISQCDRCQKSRVNKLQKGSEDFHQIPVPSKVWSQVAIDIMTMKKVDDY